MQNTRLRGTKALMEKGYVSAHRKMLDNPVVMKDAEHFAVWMWLLLNATHKNFDVIFKGKKVSLSSGQLLTGRVKIAQELKISESKVERILKLFENEHQIEQQTSNKNRIITVVKWCEYQRSEQQNEQQLNNNWTTTEQQLNTYNKYNNINTCNSNISNNLPSNVNNVNNGNNNPPTPLEGGVGKKKQKKKCVVLFQEFIDANPNNGLSAELIASLGDWMEYKDQRRDKYEPKGMQELLKRALKYEREYGTESVIDVIGDSMANNYQGITWGKLDRLPKRTNERNGSVMDDLIRKLQEEERRNEN